MTRQSMVIERNDWRHRINAHCPRLERPAEFMGKLQAAFRGRLQFPAHLEASFGDALSYLLDHPGNMVRPRIVCEIALAYGIPEASAIDLAIALEYFHTASLVFDDLPCMDNATMRRSAPCIHLPYGQSAAILAALALINRAYSLAWGAVAVCAEDVRQPALRFLEERLGLQGLLNGQALDLNYWQLPHSLGVTDQVARGKTVSLIALTLVLPAMLGAASKRELRLLNRISMFWGLAYQTVDDLKDVLENSSATGKTGGRDELLDRPNAALVLGVPAAVERLARLLQLGDLSLERLLKIQPRLVFLRGFRFTLKGELNQVLESAGAIPIDRKR